MTDDADNSCTAGASKSPVGDRDMLTLKHSPDGELLWTARRAGPSHNWNETNDGMLCRYVTIKYDSAGNEQWVAYHQEESGIYDRA